MFCESIFGPVKQWGFRNVSVTSRYEVSETNVTMDVGLAFQSGVQIELMEIHDGSTTEYERNAAEAERWDGSDPYRLVSMP